MKNWWAGDADCFHGQPDFIQVCGEGGKQPQGEIYSDFYSEQSFVSGGAYGFPFIMEKGLVRIRKSCNLGKILI